MTTPQDEIKKLRDQLTIVAIPDEVRDKIQLELDRLERLSGNDFTLEADRITRWIEWITSLPWGKRSQDHLDLPIARETLEKHHYGLGDVKERILEYLAVLKLQMSTGEPVHAPMLLLVGLVGTGKTTMAYAIAEALGRPLVRIPFGGLGSARDLRGQSRLHDESEPGQVIKAMKRAKVKNPVMLLDELDRVNEETRHDIMGVLVELLDPQQNQAYLDHYLDVPFDLSEVMFIATANNTNNIATAVMDRLEPISMPSYTDQEKVIIAQKYLLPQAQKEASLPAGVLTIDDDVWPTIVRPLGYDAGIRTLQRTIERLARKTAMLLVTGQNQVVHVTKTNIEQFIPRW